MVVICISFNLMLTIWSLVEYKHTSYSEESKELEAMIDYSCIGPKFRWGHLKSWPVGVYDSFYWLSIVINIALGGFFIIPSCLLLYVHL